MLPLDPPSILLSNTSCLKTKVLFHYPMLTYARRLCFRNNACFEHSNLFKVKRREFYWKKRLIWSRMNKRFSSSNNPSPIKSEEMINKENSLSIKRASERRVRTSWHTIKNISSRSNNDRVATKHQMKQKKNVFKIDIKNRIDRPVHTRHLLTSRPEFCFKL